MSTKENLLLLQKCPEPTLDRSSAYSEEPIASVVAILLQTWEDIRQRYQVEIRKFQFKKTTKSTLRALAQDFYNQFKDHMPTGYHLVRDEGVWDEFFSIQIYGQENYPVFTYPYNILVAESLTSHIFTRITESLSRGDCSLKSFIREFWYEKRRCKVKLSPVDIQLLTQIFSKIKTRSSIDFPNATEAIGAGSQLNGSAVSRRYTRLLHLGILGRYSTINYGRLGLVPLLKRYHSKDKDSKIERIYCLWEIEFTPQTKLRLLVIPIRSTFWMSHTGWDTDLVYFDERGANFKLFKSQKWIFNPPTDWMNLLNHYTKPSSHWRSSYDPPEPFPFRSSDLRILTELQKGTERTIQHLGSRTGLHPKYIPHRLKELRQEGLFQTSFSLTNIGLNEKFLLYLSGNNTDLDLVSQAISIFPQYYLIRSRKSVYSCIWISPEMVQKISRLMLDLPTSMNLQEFYFSPYPQKSRVQFLDFPALWNEKENCWFSEPPI